MAYPMYSASVAFLRVRRINIEIKIKIKKKVGVCAAQSCPGIVQFFDFVENIYMYSLLFQHTGGPFWSVQVVEC